MTCSNCQHLNAPTARFCEACGTPLQRVCPGCGNANNSTANFCSECGQKLSGSAASHPTASVSKDPAAHLQSSTRQAERRQLTVLFCDLVGSTALSETLDAEDFRQVILDYQQVAEAALKKHGGHVGQYLGDGLLVYFGYPRGLENAPRSAVRAGLDILVAVEKANRQWLRTGKPEIAIRIGIHTGLVVVDEHMALGETVNIAARLEGLAPANNLVISAHTQKLVQG